MCHMQFVAENEVTYIRSQYPERASALDFKNAVTRDLVIARDVVFCLFLVINVKRYRLWIISRNA